MMTFYKVLLMKNQKWPTNTTLLLLSTLCPMLTVTTVSQDCYYSDTVAWAGLKVNGYEKSS